MDLQDNRPAKDWGKPGCSNCEKPKARDSYVIPEAQVPKLLDPNLWNRGDIQAQQVSAKQEYTGGSVSYYKVKIEEPTSEGLPYEAECNDIIEALGMDYAEGNAFKAIWRICAARTLGKSKAGYKDAVYDAEKVVFFGKRMLLWAKKESQK